MNSIKDFTDHNYEWFMHYYNISKYIRKQYLPYNENWGTVAIVAGAATLVGFIFAYLWKKLQKAPETNKKYEKYENQLKEKVDKKIEENKKVKEILEKENEPEKIIEKLITPTQSSNNNSSDNFSNSNKKTDGNISTASSTPQPANVPTGGNPSSSSNTPSINNPTPTQPKTQIVTPEKVQPSRTSQKENSKNQPTKLIQIQPTIEKEINSSESKVNLNPLIEVSKELKKISTEIKEIPKDNLIQKDTKNISNELNLTETKNNLQIDQIVDDFEERKNDIIETFKNDNLIKIIKNKKDKVLNLINKQINSLEICKIMIKSMNSFRRICDILNIMNLKILSSIMNYHQIVANNLKFVYIMFDYFIKKEKNKDTGKEKEVKLVLEPIPLNYPKDKIFKSSIFNNFCQIIDKMINEWSHFNNRIIKINNEKIIKYLNKIDLFENVVKSLVKYSNESINEYNKEINSFPPEQDSLKKEAIEKIKSEKSFVKMKKIIFNQKGSIMTLYDTHDGGKIQDEFAGKIQSYQKFGRRLINIQSSGDSDAGYMKDINNLSYRKEFNLFIQNIKKFNSSFKIINLIYTLLKILSNETMIGQLIDYSIDDVKNQYIKIDNKYKPLMMQQKNDLSDNQDHNLIRSNADRLQRIERDDEYEDIKNRYHGFDKKLNNMLNNQK